MSMSDISPEKLPNHPAPARRQPVIGVLLIHGLNGSRHDMRELAELLRSHGMVAENILLPGHGTQVRDMLRPGGAECAGAVRDELCPLRKRCDMVFLVDHSLEGARWLHRAAHEKVDGIIT